MNTEQTFISKAPANCMLLGEHSVVYGYPALACALDQWIEIEWRALPQAQLRICSEIAEHTTDLNAHEIHPKLQFVGAACQYFQTHLQAQQQGWQLDIHSQFSSTIGLGSSAAVLAATLIGLNRICRTEYSKLELWQIGKQIIQQIQGRGSAADLAATLFGGIVYFRPPSNGKPCQIDSLAINMDILLVYSGYKTPTAEVLQIVADNWHARSAELKQLYQAMGAITEQAHQALMAQNLPLFYRSFEQYQQLMDQLGVSDMTLDFLIAQLCACPKVWASKISGSGLGDCVLAIGEVYRKHRPQQEAVKLLENCPEPDAMNNYLQIQLPISPLGTHIISKTDLTPA